MINNKLIKNSILDRLEYLAEPSLIEEYHQHFMDYIDYALLCRTSKNKLTDDEWSITINSICITHILHHINGNLDDNIITFGNNNEIRKN